MKTFAEKKKMQLRSGKSSVKRSQSRTRRAGQKAKNTPSSSPGSEPDRVTHMEPKPSLYDFLGSEDLENLAQSSKSLDNSIKTSIGAKKRHEELCWRQSNQGQKCALKSKKNLVKKSHCFRFCQEHYLEALYRLFKMLLTSDINYQLADEQQSNAWTHAFQMNIFEQSKNEIVVDQKPTGIDFRFGGSTYSSFEVLWDDIVKTSWISQNCTIVVMFALPGVVTPADRIIHATFSTRETNIVLEPDHVQYAGNMFGLVFEVQYPGD